MYEVLSEELSMWETAPEFLNIFSNLGITFLRNCLTKIRFDENVGIGVKPISKEGTSRLVRKAIDYAIENKIKYIMIIKSFALRRINVLVFYT